MKNINLGSLSIPITQYASQGNAVLGIRDSGKTYSATYLAECLLTAKIPFVAFDPSGTWRFLRVPGVGKGFPVVVAGGMQPDLPLTPQSAPEIVRAAMKANVSLVIDLYSMDLSKADWGRIVESCVRVLLYENGQHGLRHIFIEEAAEFCPQQIQGDKARVYAEVEKLARIGGNALLGYTLINQRAEQVNKAVLELCDCLFLHRQKGKNSIKSLEKWLELSTGGDVKQIIKGLPQLPSGEAWVWPANADHAVHVKMPQKQSFHPDRRALTANPKAANAERVDAGEFVEQLKGTLEKFVQEADANDPAKLKARIRELLTAQKKNGAAAAPVDVSAIEDRGYQRGLNVGRDEIRQLRRSMRDSVLAAVNAAFEQEPAIKALAAVRAPSRPAFVKVRPVVAAQPTGDISKSEMKILTVLSQQDDGCEMGRLTLLTGYRKSGGFLNSLSRLRVAGLIEGANTGVMRITDEGRAHGPFPELPQGEDLLQYWLSHPSFGSCERKVLAALAEEPEGMDIDGVLAVTGYQKSGGFLNSLSSLRTAGILVGRNTETMRISPNLMS